MDRVSTLAAYAVLSVWAASAIDGIWRSDYEALRYTTPIMGVLAAALWGIKVIRNGKNSAPDE